MTDTWKSVPLRFALHVAIGVLMFAVVGIAAVGLHAFVSWMDSKDVAEWMIVVALGLEYTIYVADCVLFAIYIGRTSWSHGRQLLQLEVH